MPTRRSGDRIASNRRRLGFTLVEMLVVIAITTVLLTIIVAPLFQSFNLTRAAQIFATAQSDARALTEKISREIDSAVSVRSGSTTVATTLNGNAVNLPINTLVVQVPGQLNPSTNKRPTVDVALPWTKLDVILAAKIGPGSPGAYVDPVTGKVDPTLKTYKGQVQTPVAPSTVMVRYFLALRDPTQPYNEPYSGILMSQTGTRDNLVSLYRSQVAQYVSESGGEVPNTALFQVTSGSSPTPVLDDPRFMVMDRDSSGNIEQDLHNLLVYHWIGLQPSWESSINPYTSTPLNSALHDATNMAHSVLQTQISRFDMIMPQYNLQSRLPTYDTVSASSGTIGVPRLTPLLQFKPTVVSNDPSAGQEASRPGEETDNAVAIAPDVFKTQYGLWNTATIRTYPAGYLPSSATNNKYSIGYPSNTSLIPGFSIFAYDPSASGANEFSSGIEYFDDYTYDNAVAALGGATGAVYPFTQAAIAANGRSGWLTNTTAQALFTPYHYLSGTGKIIASFDISEVGTQALTSDPNQDPNRPNEPTLYVPNAPLAPESDSGAGAGSTYPWSPEDTSPSTDAYDINSAFNRAWENYTNLQPNLQRFIDLRVLPNEDTTYSPLYPLAVNGGVTNFQVQLSNGEMMNRCRIVPGSESVIGPDQAPGDHYGHPIRYTRVTANPGINQYRINYVDQQEPTDPTSGQVTPAAYSAAIGLSSAQLGTFSVSAYDPTNFVSAVIQPRYKVGYIQLNSDPAQPLPQGYTTNGTLTLVPFKIDYRFQLNGTLPASSVPAGAGPSDAFAVDYDTRQLMQVLLTLRSLPQSNFMPNPQTVTLKATASLQNVLH